MEIESISIKLEQEDNIIDEYAPNVFNNCEKFPIIVKTEVINSPVEYLPTNFSNKEISETTRFKCKSKPVDSFNNEETVLNPPQMKVDDIFDQDNLVDLSKLKQLINQSMPESSNIKHEDTEFDAKSIIDEKFNIKKEEDACDISEDLLLLVKSEVSTSEENDYKERCDTFNADDNIQECSKYFDANEIQRTLEPTQQRRKKKINSNIHKCRLCSYQTTVQDHLMRHINGSHNKDKTKIKCQFCDKSFAFKNSLEDHLLKQHKKEIENDLNSFITLEILKCKFCAYETTRRNNFNVHTTSLHNEQRIKKHCQFCDKSFVLQSSLDNHVLKKHKDKTDLLKSKIKKCNICAYETTLAHKLNAHINTVHNKQRIKIYCQICDKAFVKQYTLDDHVLKQHKDKISLIKSKIKKCNLCSYQTIHKHLLDYHTNSMHSDNKQTSKINCRFCNQSFSFKYALHDHLLKNHNQEIKIDMNTIHTCNLCSYSSIRKDNLNQHINSVHNKERIKNKCKFCNRCFVLQDSLNLHVLNEHSNEISSDMKDLIMSKVHSCKICSYKSIRRSHLNKHINSVHKNK